MSEQSSTRLAELTALMVLTWVALLCGLALGIWSLFIEPVDAGSDLLRAAVTWWSSLALIVGTIAGVGATVLSGVQSLLRRR